MRGPLGGGGGGGARDVPTIGRYAAGDANNEYNRLCIF